MSVSVRVGVVGLSPRVRGNQPRIASRSVFFGSIPAGAGEPIASDRRRCLTEVYPRGCGGTTFSGSAAWRGTGLSPRVRGNQLPSALNRVPVGSIPAGAGEPSSDPRLLRQPWVYPRGCGGTHTRTTLDEQIRGLSPRVRGNRGDPLPVSPATGSIPAGAGEPAPPRPGRGWGTVYPRGCGGTIAVRLSEASAEGLSPRVRGNQLMPDHMLTVDGSIPAGAGEPSANTGRVRTSGVYPRGCGGTSIGRPGGAAPRGLSPRVRGNLVDLGRSTRRARSIPAGAGEPRSAPRTGSRRRVYPRGCGGTRYGSRWTSPHSGLSPRVRGNHPPRTAGRRGCGSIPAGAGEPGDPRARGRLGEVYPRGCGGTTNFGVAGIPLVGLSPRVRGNHRQIHCPCRVVGSIPAGAGEPSTTPRRRRRSWVYPRGCGGTGPVVSRSSSSQGLSPRVRGNQVLQRLVEAGPGSIPAGAGEPTSGDS